MQGVALARPDTLEGSAASGDHARVKTWLSLASLVIALAVSLSGADVHAQGAPPSEPVKDVARQRYNEGVKAFDAGQFEEARIAFGEAYKLTQAPGILLNLGISEAKSNHPVEGGNYLVRFLADYKEATPEQKTSAAQWIEECKKRAALVQVSVDVAQADISFDGASVGKSPLPHPVFVQPGSHTVTAAASGATATVTVDAALGTVAQANLRLRSLLGGPGESCRARADCEEGLRCVSSVCRDDREGTRCLSAADCGGRLLCAAGFCKAPHASGGKGPPGGEEPDEPSKPAKTLEGVRGHVGLMLGGGPTHPDNTFVPPLGSLLFSLKGGVFIDRGEIGIEFSPASFVLTFEPFSVPLVQLNAYGGYHIPVAGPVSWPLRFGAGFSHYAPAGGRPEDVTFEGRADLIGVSIHVDPILIDLYVPSFRVNTDFDRAHLFTYVFGAGASWLP